MRAASMTRQQSIGWLTGALFFLHAWLLRVAPSVMLEELLRDFSAGTGILGNLPAD